MARYQFLLLVILSALQSSLQDTTNNEVDSEDVNPFAEAAQAILKEQNAQNIGSMISSLMQNGGAAKIGDALSKLGNEEGGELLQGLGSLMAGSGQDKSGEGIKGVAEFEDTGSGHGS